METKIEQLMMGPGTPGWQQLQRLTGADESWHSCPQLCQCSLSLLGSGESPELLGKVPPWPFPVKYTRHSFGEGELCWARWGPSSFPFLP